MTGENKLTEQQWCQKAKTIIHFAAFLDNSSGRT